MKASVSSWARYPAAMAIVLFVATHAGAAVVGFEDVTPATPYTGPGGGYYWNGPDLSGTQETDPYGGSGPVYVGSFQSGGASFVNRYNTNYGSWSGFAYSNTSDTTTPGFTNQFSAYTGSGFGGAGNYGVGFGHVDGLTPGNVTVDDLQQLPWLELPNGHVIQSAYVTNTTYAALSMRDGDFFSKKFGGATGDDPDWFKLTVYGTNALGNPLLSTVELFLADYTFTDNSQDYIVDDWMLLDLTPLADAKRLYFNLSSSDKGPWGMNTPAQFAIDDITTGEVPEASTLAIFGVGGLVAGGVSLLRRHISRRMRTC
ncbi:MAG: DUF4465 domain-containing protein [Thermoguttaceae bacterium]|nr:DUF4465 domain-containing protein [Thermoguttaceae bacterium]